jgi:hypothetical protein
VQVAQALVVDQNGRRIARAAKDDAMTDHRGELALQLLPEPFGERPQGRSDVRHILERVGSIDQ